MPFLFLSPSTQDFNPYVTTGNEQYWMNRIADEMEPYLRASGVNFTRNNPAGSAAQSIRDSNAGQYDFHLALHSNAMPEASAGTARGVDAVHGAVGRGQDRAVQGACRLRLREPRRAHPHRHDRVYGAELRHAPHRRAARLRRP